MIQKSINLPAQSLYNSLETVYTLFKAAGVQKVVWYCGRELPDGGERMTPSRSSLT